jgi:L-fuconate dehydratase
LSIKIVDAVSLDIRFPTSLELDGSDAMNPDPDYSAAYVILKTDVDGLEGHGMTFTIGNGNDLCVQAIELLKRFVVGKFLHCIAADMSGFWREVTGDSQIRWLGPEKGVVHLAAAALINAVWDLWAKAEEKPLWKLVVDMTPSQFVSCIDFRYISDALSREEALQVLSDLEDSKAEREAKLKRVGYPAYSTAAGWLGYSDDKLRSLLREQIAQGWTRFKLKVGGNLEDDLRRLAIAREEIGPNNTLMVDANQVWDVAEACEWMRQLDAFNLLWIEEPTSPDDVLGHAAIRNAVAPIGVATGEHCHNRVMFKQFFQAKAMNFCQIDSCRLGGVNEILAVLLMAKKFDVPVCPHAGGVGLCEYVQHLSIIDYVAVSGTTEKRMTEYAGQLHEHFFDPCVIKNGNYVVPNAPGYSITMRPESLSEYEYPHGSYWSGARTGRNGRGGLQDTAITT